MLTIFFFFCEIIVGRFSPGLGPLPSTKMFWLQTPAFRCILSYGHFYSSSTLPASRSKKIDAVTLQPSRSTSLPRSTTNPYARRGMTEICCGKNHAVFLAVKTEKWIHVSGAKLVFTAFFVSYFVFEGHGTISFQTCSGFLCAWAVVDSYTRPF